MPSPLIVNINGVNVELPIAFGLLPSGDFPMYYFDENFAFLIQNLFQLFANLPTVIPQTPSTLWNNAGAISITPPLPYPHPGFTPW